MRKPIQMLAMGPSADDLVVLCDDGSIWTQTGRGWEKHEPVPGWENDELPPVTERQRRADSKVYVDPDWPPTWLGDDRIFAWNAQELTEITDSNGLILAARVKAVIVVAKDGVAALPLAEDPRRLGFDNDIVHKGVPIKYWTEIP